MVNSDIIIDGSIQDVDLNKADDFPDLTGQWEWQPAGNNVPITVTGTALTTNSAILITSNARTGSTNNALFYTTLSTAQIKNPETVFFIRDDRNHDDAAADNYYGLTYSQNGNWPGTNNSVARALRGKFNGIIGASGANAEVYAVEGDISGATLTAGTFAAGHFLDGTNTVKIADGTEAINTAGRIVAKNLPSTARMTFSPTVHAFVDSVANLTGASVWDSTASPNGANAEGGPGPVLRLTATGAAASAVIIFPVSVPNDFGSWPGQSDDVTVRARIQTDAGTLGNDTIVIDVLDVDGTTDLDDDSVNGSNLSTTFTGWDCAVSGGTMTKGGSFFVKITVSLPDAGDVVDIGDLTVKYTTG